MDTPCNNCGAKLGPTTPSCPYCGAVTAYGQQVEHAAATQNAHHQHAREQHQLNLQMERDRQRRAAMESAATFALISGLVGFVTCCLPVGPVLAIVMGLKARRLARETGFARPMRGTIGLVCGLLGLLSAAGGWSYFIYDTQKKDEDIEKLREAAVKVADDKDLTDAAACTLVRLEVLESTSSVYRAKKIKCRGDLKRTGDRAVLTRVRVLKSSPYTVKGCLVWRGERWVVEKTPRYGKCWTGGDDEDDDKKGKKGKAEADEDAKDSKESGKTKADDKKEAAGSGDEG